MISVSVSSPGPSVSTRSAGASVVAAGDGTTVSTVSSGVSISVATGDVTDVVVVALADLPGLAATTPARVVTQVSGALTLDVSAANTFFADLTADLTSIVWTGRRSDERSERVTLYLRQAGAGGWAIMLPDGEVKWAGGTPLLSSAAGTVDCIVFDLLDAGVFGNLVGLDYQ